MARVHHFQRYSSYDNTVTNNTLLLIACIYAYASQKAAILINELIRWRQLTPPSQVLLNRTYEPGRQRLLISPPINSLITHAAQLVTNRALSDTELPGDLTIRDALTSQRPDGHALITTTQLRHDPNLLPESCTTNTTPRKTGRRLNPTLRRSSTHGLRQRHAGAGAAAGGAAGGEQMMAGPC